MIKALASVFAASVIVIPLVGRADPQPVIVISDFQSGTPDASGSSIDPSHPASPLQFDRTGAAFGGTDDVSTWNGITYYNNSKIYKLKPPTVAGGHWTATSIYAFRGSTKSPNRPVLGPNDALYGINLITGAAKGDIYRLSPPTTAGAAWTYKVIRRLGKSGASSDPALDISVDPRGNVYSAESYRGVECTCNIIRKYVPNARGTSWTATTLYQGDPAVISRFISGPTFAADGSAYGIAEKDGPGGITSPGSQQFVYKISPPVGTATNWSFDVIYRLPVDKFLADGGQSISFQRQSALVLDAQGGLFAREIPKFGEQNPSAPSPVFHLTPPASPGGAWTRQEVYQPGSYDVNGRAVIGTVSSNLLLAPSGKVYAAIAPYNEIVRITPGAGGTFSADILTTRLNPSPNYSITDVRGTRNFDPTIALSFHDGQIFGVDRFGGAGCASVGCGFAFRTAP